MAVAAASVEAATLYKCIAADRHVTYQSQPCAEGTQAWAREYPSELRREPSRSAPAAPKSAPDAPARGPASEPAPLPADASCDAARREVERIASEQWLELSLERLRKLDDWVRERCVAETGTGPES
jgi:hypothetical protein